ncbi:MAG: c-type cytochrome [Nitrospinae bacterium]|nr:c-type cytochrome [Nitrospinota bacterium]
MKRIFLSCVLLLTVYCLLLTVAYAGEIPAKPKIPNTPEAIEAGKKIYFKRCSFCHGLTGGGDGPVAELLSPRPRNFQTGLFKFRSTESGALPIDEDMFFIVSHGIKGTAMESFDIDKKKSGLTEDERWQVIYFIQTLSDMWKDDEEFKNSKDPDDQNDYRYNKIIKIGEPPPFSKEIVEKGKEVYKNSKCWECHGMDGRGDGKSAPTLKDDWKFSIRPRNLTKPWTYKGGNDVKDIFFKFTTGLNGTPMPSFKLTVPDEDRWALSNYVKSLHYQPKDNIILKSKLIEGDIPTDPNDKRWNETDNIDVRLTGQVLVKPRWQNFSIDMVTVRSFYNDKEIGFQLTWDDPFKDIVHEGSENMHQTYTDAPTQNGIIKTYVEIYSPDYKPNNFKDATALKLRDAIALQFPTKFEEGTEKPHFLNGSSGKPVNLWYWRADYNEDTSKGKPVIELTSTDFKNSFSTHPDNSQMVDGKAVFKDGQWKLVMKRSLNTDDKGDIQFIKGKFIPMAINAWDGSNGESGMSKSVSSWHYVILETPVPSKVYLYTLLSIIAVGVVEIVLVKKTKT